MATWKLIELKRLFCSKKGRVSATQLTPLLLSWLPQPLFAAFVTPVTAPKGKTPLVPS